MAISDNDKFIQVFNNLYASILELYNDMTNYKGNYQEDFAICINKLKTKNMVIGRSMDFLDGVRRVRNIKIHDNFVNENLLINDQMLQRCIELTQKLQNPPILNEYIDKRHRNIYQVDINSGNHVHEIVHDMIVWWYSYVPVLADSRIVWLLDNDVIVARLSQNKILDTTTKIGDINIELLWSRDKHIYMIASNEDEIEKIINLFDYYYSKNQKLLAVVVTDNGKDDGNILEIITPYDLNWIEENLL